MFYVTKNYLNRGCHKVGFEMRVSSLIFYFFNLLFKTSYIEAIRRLITEKFASLQAENVGKNAQKHSGNKTIGDYFHSEFTRLVGR